MSEAGEQSPHPTPLTPLPGGTTGAPPHLGFYPYCGHLFIHLTFGLCPSVRKALSPAAPQASVTQGFWEVCTWFCRVIAHHSFIYSLILLVTGSWQSLASSKPFFMLTYHDLKEVTSILLPQFPPVQNIDTAYFSVPCGQHGVSLYSGIYLRGPPGAPEREGSLPSVTARSRPGSAMVTKLPTRGRAGKMVKTLCSQSLG